MEALSVAESPRAIAGNTSPNGMVFAAWCFRDGPMVELQSKSGRMLTRYFPELVQAVRAINAKRFVLDAEIMVPQGAAFSFDALLQRIHPAASRVRRLAQETPAQLIVFDLLAAADGVALVELPLRERRKKLEAFFDRYLGSQSALQLSPATTRLGDAKGWLERVGTTLDGIIAKRRDYDYRSGDRSGMQKIKNFRSADCVVGGFRYNEGSRAVGSLLLGLYDDTGLLHHVGFTSSIAAHEKKALTARLERLIGPPGFTGNAPGGPSRWSTARSAEWQPLKLKLVAEVRYDHFTGERFRHGTKFLRWRPDKRPRQCTMEQVAQKEADLAKHLH
jgi:ATP-dependent DNA ligase